MTISRGRFGGEVFSGGIMEISGGEFNQSVRTDSGGTLRISGGVFNGPLLSSLSQTTISGGEFRGPVRVQGRSSSSSAFERLFIIGSEFLLDGVPLEGLSVGQSMLLSERGPTLSGTLADGSTFSFHLNSDPNVEGDFFAIDLSVSLVPPRCGEADVASPYGTIDVEDVLALRENPITSSGDPTQPADAFDLSESLNVVAAGCP